MEKNNVIQCKKINNKTTQNLFLVVCQGVVQKGLVSFSSGMWNRIFCGVAEQPKIFLNL